MDLVLDANIIIDHIGKRKPFYEAARNVCLLGITQKADLYISATVVTDIFYLLQKDFGAKKAHEMIELNLGFLHPVGISPEDTRKALIKAWDSLEDCLVSQCAEKIRADYIVTRNTQGFERSRVPAVSPEQLFELIELEGIMRANLFL